jgi:hypothetical protein
VSGLTKFYSDPPASEMEDQDDVFRLSWKDVKNAALDSRVTEQRELPLDLSPDEMHVFRKCLESGLGCWVEVVQLALWAATSERSS